MLDIIRMLMLALLVSGAASANGIDPTKPPSWSIPKAAAPKAAATGELESIVVNGKQKLAIIGGKGYRQGDSWGDSQIRQIHRDKVVLSDGRVLRLFPQLSVLTQE